MRTGYRPNLLSQLCYVLGVAPVFHKIVLGAPLPTVEVVVWFWVFFSLGRLLHSRALRIADQRRAEAADLTFRRAVQAAETGKTINASLFLRPFKLTGRLYVRRGVVRLPSTIEFLEDSGIDYETHLAEILEPLAPLIALGIPGEHLGAGRLLTEEDDWQSVAFKLMTACRFLFVLPGPTSGTQWEIYQILEQNWLHKSIFLMPPKRVFQQEIAPEEYWKETREIFLRKGLNLPEYDPIGSWLFFAGEGQCTKIVDELIQSALGSSQRPRTGLVVKQLAKLITGGDLPRFKQYLIDNPAEDLDLRVGGEPPGFVRLKYLQSCCCCSWCQCCSCWSAKGMKVAGVSS